MRRTLGIITLCTAMLPLAGAVIAQEEKPVVPVTAPRPSSPQPAPSIGAALRTLQPRMVDMLAERLNLTDDQKKKIADMLIKAEQELAPKIELQRTAAQAFAAALTNTASTEAELTTAADKAMKAETEIVNARIKTLTTLRTQLSPEQNRELANILEQYTTLWRPVGPPSTAVTPPAKNVN